MFLDIKKKKNPLGIEKKCSRTCSKPPCKNYHGFYTNTARHLSGQGKSNDPYEQHPSLRWPLSSTFGPEESLCTSDKVGLLTAVHTVQLAT